MRPIYGPALDGTLPGNEVIELGRSTSRVVFARAMGPMQFLPGTWSRYASDGNGDGKADVQNVFDASLAAARYLCSGGLNLRDQSQVMTAILRYNNSVAYAQNVLGWAAAYATGVVPIDLPPITGPIPPIADAHLDDYQGLGPGLPMNALGLPANDPLALVPLVDMGRTDVASQIPTTMNGQVLGPLPGPPPAASPMMTQPEPAQNLPPWMQPPPQQNCAVFCLGTNPPAGGAAAAAARGAAAGYRPASVGSGRDRAAAGCRTCAAVCERGAAGAGSLDRPCPKAWGLRPARPPDRPRDESADRTPPTLGGDVRTSH